MLSKNNYKERLRKMEEKKERFSIRKFSVGAASVLIGFFLTGIGAQKADAATTNTNKDVTESTPTQDDSAVANNATTSKVLDVKPASQATTLSVKSSASENTSSTASSSATSNSIESNATSSSANVVLSVGSKTSAAVTNKNINSEESNTNSSAAVSQGKAANVSAVTAKSEEANNQNPSSIAATPTSEVSKASEASLKTEALVNDQKITAKSTIKLDQLKNSFVANINDSKVVTPTDEKTTVAENSDATKENIYKNTEDVSDWASFISALSNSNVDHINITKDITVTGKVNGTSVTQPVLYGGRQKLDGKDIARKVTISGNNNTIDFTNQNLDLTDANQGDTHSAWDMTFEDVTIKADKLKASAAQTDLGSYSPISLTKVSADKQALDTITFKNVTTEVNGRSIITGMTTNSAAAANTGYEKYTLVLKGDNNLTNTPWESGLTPGDNGDAISAGYIVVEDGTTTVNMKATSSYNLQYGGAAVRANADYVKDDKTGAFTKYPVNVKEGATLNITGGKDVKGIVSLGTGAQLLKGAVNIDGNVNMDMGEGHSIAIYSGNLVTGKTGNLDITTKMISDGTLLGGVSNLNSNGYGVLSIGVGIPGAVAITGHDTDSVIDDNGSIKIVRTSTEKGQTPLIAMGSGASSGNNIKTLNVNEGATLDLQDNAMQDGLGMIFINGWIGGPSSENLEGYINFNNPEYVNLQRLNPTLPKNGGAFIFNERNKQQNVISNTPVAQWNRANLGDNPDYTWMITNSSSRGLVGANAGQGFAPIGFNPSKTIIEAPASSYLTSNGSVIMGATQGAGQYNGSQKANQNSNQGTITAGANSQYLNSFLNNFSWWTPQRIAMGSKLLEKDSPIKSSDKDLYDPEVQTINGNTNQTLKDLDPNDGIKDLLQATVTTDKDGKQVMGAAPVANWKDLISSVDWYNSSDSTEWNKEMVDAEGKSEAQPKNPTGNLKTTDKSAWAKVTYKDGSVDFVNIPLNITNPDADEYTPSYKQAQVKQGDTVETGAPTFTDKDDKVVTAPEGTKYEIAGNPTFPEGVTAKVDPSTGNVTVTTSSNTPAGPVFVPVKVTYPDGSTETTDAPIAVGPNTFIGTDYTVTVTESLKNLHETTANSMYPDPMSTVDSIIWWNNNDVRNGKDVDGHKITNYDGVTAEWIIPIDTNVDKASMEAPLPGVTELSADASKNPSIKLTFGQNSELIKETGTNLFSTPEHSLTLSDGWYGQAIEMQGAAPVADAASKKLEVTPAKAGDKLTDAEMALIDTTNLNKLTANKPVSYTWVNALKAGDTQGTVRITFSDKDKNGQSTYLDVELPAGSIKVTNPTKDVTNDSDQADKVNKTVTRTINIDVAGKTSTYTTETVTLHRTATEDLVTNKVTYGPWNTDGAKFKAVTAPAEAGYTVSNPDAAPEVDVTGDTTDSTVTFNYTANEQTRKINFVDPNGKTVSTQTLTGKTGTSVTIGNGEGQTSLDVPKGYEIVPNTEVPTTVPFNADSKDNGDITVKVQPKIDVIDGRNDKNNSDVYRQVTRTITVNIEGQKPQVVTQTLDFYRTKSTNEATGEVTYTDWTSNMTDGSTSFPEVEIPTAAGYTRTITGGEITTKDGKDYVASASGLADGTPVNNVVVTVNYIKAEQTATIKFVNNADHNDVVSTQEVPGETGETVPVTLQVPANWQVVGGQQIPSSFTFGSTPIKDTIVYVEHKTEDVTNDPSEKDNVNKTITRTIETEVAGKTTKLEDQTVTLHRTATKDLVTNKVTYGAWDTSKFDAVTAPEVAGYTVSNPDAAPAMDVTSDTADSTVIFTYTANEQPTDADKYTPEGQDVHTNIGGTPEASEGIANIPSLPTGTKYTWKDGEPDTKTPGTKPSTVVVTYPDGSQDEVPVKVVVEKTTPAATDADKYTPEGQDVKTKQGVVPEASEGIKNKTDLPEGTKYTWKETPDVTTPGDHDATVVVTYPDGSQDEVPVKVVVEKTTPAATDADKYTPAGQDVKTKQGVVPEASEGIKNKTDLPEGTKYTWKETPDVTTPGNHDATVVVTYPDGSQDEVPVKVVVEKTTPAATDADKYTPEGQDIPTIIGTIPNPEAGIKNRTDLPEGTKYTWKETPDVTTPGNHDATVVVTYPDGSQDEVPVKVVVTIPEGQTINTTTGVVPEASEGIKNKTDLPEGTKYTWKETPDVTTPGSHDATIVVTLPNGKTVEVPIKVDVTDTQSTPVVTPTDADRYTPEGQDVPTAVDTIPEASEGIKNKTDLPEGTKYTWKETPDVTTPGNHDATVVVTYPDGSQDEVPVKIIVASPEGQDIHTNEGVTPDPSDGIKNRNDMPEGTKYTWKETPDVTTPGNHDATIIVTLPNGKTVEVPVKVIVDKDEDINPIPEGQQIHTNQGTLPDPSDGIKNKDDMPEGTEYTWKKKPDIKTPGKHKGIVRVTFPNGETVDVPVTVVVAPKSDRNDIAGVHGGDNESGNNVRGNNENITGVKGTYEGSTTGNENSNGNSNRDEKFLDSYARTLPQTGANDGAAAMLGILIASVGAIMGLAVEKKRRN